ncbi:MAG: tRNA dihydrouridine synthase DusB [Streptococcaceae bacterium]|jgi:nifR3 family TIM-barrel protein|nr:tRNA dihydrouridine synthase DusB [Streptococcaceae bacterium]
MKEQSFKIGTVEIPNRVIVAPMAGISNLAFRVIAKEFGAGLVVMEMISDKGVHYRNQKTLGMLQIDPSEHPISLQIFGGEKVTLVEAAAFVEEHTSADIIDINMGCPVNKVIKAAAGARLLLDPEKIYEVVRALVNAVSIPVTVKMRIGWDEEHLFAAENALAAEAAGASAVAMHGRTRMQMYQGVANWEILREVASKLAIPFIGNGDVKTPEDAQAMLEEVGADAVMIGRAALGNPWMLLRTEHFLRTEEQLPEPSVDAKIKMAKVHLQKLVQLKGEKQGVCEFRQLAAYYLKGIPRAVKVKVAINQVESETEVTGLLDEFAEKSAK